MRDGWQRTDKVASRPIRPSSRLDIEQGLPSQLVFGPVRNQLTELKRDAATNAVLSAINHRSRAPQSCPRALISQPSSIDRTAQRLQLDYPQNSLLLDDGISSLTISRTSICVRYDASATSKLRAFAVQ